MHEDVDVVFNILCACSLAEHGIRLQSNTQVKTQATLPWVHTDLIYKTRELTAVKVWLRVGISSFTSGTFSKGTMVVFLFSISVLAVPG